MMIATIINSVLREAVENKVCGIFLDLENIFAKILR
jgi:hypothetical protein